MFKKKLAIALCAATACACTAVGLTACQEEETPPAYLGVYYAVMGDTLNQEVSIELLADGKWQSGNELGDYLTVGDSMLFIVEGQTMVAKVENDILTVGEIAYAKTGAELPKDTAGETDPNAPAKDEKAQLRMPTLTRDGDKYTWTAVEGADGYQYEYYYNDEEVTKNTITDLTYTFNPQGYGDRFGGLVSTESGLVWERNSGYYTFRLRARGNGVTTTNSEWVYITYEYVSKNPVAQTKLEVTYDVESKTVKVTNAKNRVYGWSADEQYAYNVYVDDELMLSQYELGTDVQSFDLFLEDIDEGAHYVRVVELKWTVGSIDAEIDTVQTLSLDIYNPYLETPEVTYLTSGGKTYIVWDEVDEADSYKILHDGQLICTATEEGFVEVNPVNPSAPADPGPVDPGDEPDEPAEPIADFVYELAATYDPAKITVTAFDDDRDYLQSSAAKAQPVYTRVNAEGVADAEGQYVQFGTQLEKIETDTKPAFKALLGQTGEKLFWLGSDGETYVEWRASSATTYHKFVPLTWKIAAQENGLATLICEEIVAYRTFDEFSMLFDTSDLKAWLNGEFEDDTFDGLAEEFIVGDVRILTQEELQANGYDFLDYYDRAWVLDSASSGSGKEAYIRNDELTIENGYFGDTNMVIPVITIVLG